MTFSSCSRFGLGVFPSYQDAEVALLKLQRSHFPVEQISFLAKCNDRHDTLSHPTSNPQNVDLMSAADDAFSTDNRVTSLSRLVDHPSQFTLSPHDCVVAGGRLGSMLASSRAFGGSILQALQALGVPEADAKLYCDRIQRGDCLVGIESSSGDFREADKILQHAQINHWQVYQFAAAPTISQQIDEGAQRAPAIAAPMMPLATSAMLVPPWPLTADAGSTFSEATLPDLRYLGVGVFRHYHETDLALQDLMLNGMAMGQVSVITGDTSRFNDFHAFEAINVMEPQTSRSNPIRDGHLHDVNRPQVGKGVTTGALVGGSVGGVTGFLVGLGTLAIPGIGPVLLAGAIGTAIATTLAGGAIGVAAGGLVGAFVGVGIPENRAQVYRDRMAEGHYIILVTGNTAEVDKAETVLAVRGIEEWGVYPLSESGLHQLEQNSNPPQAKAASSTEALNA